MRVEITDGVIPAAEIVAEIKAGSDGAVCVFDGIVRDNTRGRKTLHLDYEAYREMALEQMRGLAGGGGDEVWRAGCGDGASAGAADGGRDECAGCGGFGASRGGVRCVPVADRYAEEDGADLEEGTVCGWGDLGGWGAVSDDAWCWVRRRDGDESSAGVVLFAVAVFAGPVLHRSAD